MLSNLKYQNVVNVKEIKDLVKTSFTEFFQERPFRHGAALAYYALLALTPILYLSMTYFGMILGHDKMSEIIETILRDNVGITDVSGIVSFLDEIDLSKSSVIMQIIGVAALLFSCTTMLNSLKISINEFYDIEQKKVKAKKVILRTLISRLVSMLFVVGITVLIIILYFAETVFLSLGNRFFEDLEMLNWIFSEFARHGIPIVTNLIIFSFIFKYLNDGVVNWKVAIRGALVTSILLYLGQLLIKYYLSTYFFAADGGVIGTVLFILVWVYYSSQIIFIGAKFTSVYSKIKKLPILHRD